MKPNKFLFPAITLLLFLSIIGDLYLLPKKIELAAVSDTEVRSGGRRNSSSVYYIIPQKQAKFSVSYYCYDYLRPGDSITLYKSLLFSKTQGISFERNGQLLSFKAGMANVHPFIWVLISFMLFYTSGIILWLINKFEYQKKRLLDASFLFSIIVLIFYGLVC